MNKINKILTLAMVALLALFSLLVNKGECGNLPEWYLFVPEQSQPFYQTYPGTTGNLKPLYDTTEIVNASGAKAIIVVNTSDSFLMDRANDINTTISGATGINLTIKDDDQSDPDPAKWIIESDYEDYNFILIGHHGNNAFIDHNIYRTGKQKVDSGCPGANKFLINRVRLRSPEGTFTNAIVMGAQTDPLITNAVNHFRGVIPGTSTITLTDQQINCWENAAQTGPININLLDPTKNSPTNYNPYQANGYNNSTQLASEYAIKYWLTGDVDYANAFRKIIYNIGVICEGGTYMERKINDDPPQYEVIELKPDFLGDNGGNLDFYIGGAVGSWSKIESSVTNLNNPVMPGKTRDEERLYVTQVLVYLTHAIYNQWAMGDNWEHFTIYNNHLNGNHPTSGALGVLTAGQYLSEDDYNYTQAQSWLYDPWYREIDDQGQLTHPNFNPQNPLTWKYSLNWGLGWTQAADIVFEPYLTSTMPNDDAGGYWNASPAHTRAYCWNAHPDDLELKEKIANYFTPASEGVFDNGADRGFADLFCMLTPPTYEEPGFGDVHGYYTASSDSQAALSFWTKKYDDDRYQWMQEKYGFNGVGGDDYWKGILNFGLYEPLLNPEPPNDLLGIKIAKTEGDPSVTIPYPLVPNTNFDGKLLAYLNSYDGSVISGVGRATFSTDEQIGEVHLEGLQPSDTFNKITLRNGFEPEDQFMIIDGINGLGHGQPDALGITEYHNNRRLFLISHCFTGNYMARKFHNVVTIEKKTGPDTYEEANYKSSTVAVVKDKANFDKTGLLDIALLDYGKYTNWGAPGLWSTDLSRTMFWQRDGDGIIVVLDEVQVHDEASAGDYRVSLNWKSIHDGANLEPFRGIGELPGNKFFIDQEGEHCAIETLLDDGVVYDQEHVQVGNEYWSGYQYANPGFTPTQQQPGPNGTMARIYAEISDYPLSTTQKIIIPSLIYTYTGDIDPSYSFSAVNSQDTIYHITNGEDIYVGKALNTDIKTVANYTVKANLFYIDNGTSYFSLAKGYLLTQSGTQLFTSDIPISIEFDMAQMEGIINIAQSQGLATIGLYNPQNYPLYVDNAPALNSAWLNGITTFNLETTQNGNEQHEFYFGGTPPQNQPPVINNPGPQTVVVGNNLSLTITATDPEQDPLTYSASNLPTGATFNTGTHIFSWTPTASQVGSYTVTFGVNDGHNPTVTLPVPITVSAQSINQPPVFTNPPGPQTVVVGNNLSLTITASDPESDPLTYSATGLPTGATFNTGTHIFSWTPTASQVGGPYTVTFGINDGHNPTVTLPVPITVSAQPPQGNNVALNKPYSVIKLFNGAPYASASDPSHTELTDGQTAEEYSASHPGVEVWAYGNPTWNEAWSAWSCWSPDPDPFDFAVTIDLGSVLDNISAVNISTMGQTGCGINFPNSIEVKTSQDNITYVGAVTITNTIGQQVAWPPLLHDFEGTFGSVSARYVKLIFHRTLDGTFIDEIEVFATEPPPNQPPVIDPIPPTTVSVKETATVNVSATDPDNDPITLSVTPLPARATFVDNGNGTGTFTLNTTRPMAGNTYEFTLTADDGQGGTDTEVITINVIGQYAPTGPDSKAK